MIEQLRARLEIAIDCTAVKAEDFEQTLTGKDISFIIGTGGRDEYELMRGAVDGIGKEGVFLLDKSNGTGFVIILLPGDKNAVPKWIFDESSSEEATGIINENPFAKIHLDNAAANIAKGIMLRGTPYARRDIEKILEDGVRILMVGHPSWPWPIVPIDPTMAPPSNLPTTMLSEFRDLKGRTCLIIGLGSLGGVAADTLYKLGANLVLIDGKEVSGANPIRQIYSLDQAGRPKAMACVQMLADIQSNEVMMNGSNSSWSWRRGCQSVMGYQAEITRELKDLAKLTTIIAKHRPEAAIVATGTEHDRAISKLLRGANIPHVVVSCYARARYFEAIVVDGKSGPCFGCIRGHLYLGPLPSLTPEQRERYEGASRDLNAEPATRIETGRAADLASHIAYGLLMKSETPWLTRALKDEQTFFLGGNSVETHEGNHVYGIVWPSEVRLYGLQELSGRGDYLECWDCGKQLRIAIPYA